MKLKKFDKAALRLLRPEIDAALAELGKKYGIRLEAANATYFGASAHFKLEMAIIGADGVAKTREREQLEAFYPQYVDKEITFRNGVKLMKGKVVGVRPRATRYPFLVEAANGKVYYLPEIIVSR